MSQVLPWQPSRYKYEALCRLMAELIFRGTQVCYQMLKRTAAFHEANDVTKQMQQRLEESGYIGVIGASAMLKMLEKLPSQHEHMTPILPELLVYKRGSDGRPADDSAIAMQVVPTATMFRCVIFCVHDHLNA